MFANSNVADVPPNTEGFSTAKMMPVTTPDNVKIQMAGNKDSSFVQKEEWIVDECNNQG